MDERTTRYAETLAAMIREETISALDAQDNAKFIAFQKQLARLFPHIFGVCEAVRFPNGFVLRWNGQSSEKQPVLFMNHHDVVEVTEGWTHAPFSGELADDRLWGRGTLDDKGGLWAMLQAADELAADGFQPARDVWFASSCTEETGGPGAPEISAWFQEHNVRFEMVFDEGGMILREPIDGAKGTFAMIGVGEKGCADLKFIARSKGGHASTPGKNTPLVRLGKFMAAVERSHAFPAELSPTVCEMLRRLAPYMGKLGKVMEQPEKLAPVLKRVIPSLSGAAAALLQTTVAFTMAQGSAGTNVLPREAWVVGNMRFSHHQGQQASFRAIEKLAKRYDLEMEVLDPGFPSRIADYNGTAFHLVERAVREVFPGVVPTPYIMTGASDSRYFDPVCDQCIRFLPFFVDAQQLASIHGVDENIRLDALAPAVDWYKYMMREA
ncbi:MAG: M20/M25/M40 family metallo-hydrolase [Ruminococcaceae bacterium]|nr:M20/M25/M40 family metallo-hydrolase [Oscillospiraceae bacterium]